MDGATEGRNAFFHDLQGSVFKVGQYVMKLVRIISTAKVPYLAVVLIAAERILAQHAVYALRWSSRS